MPGPAQDESQLRTPRPGHSCGTLWAIRGQLGLGSLYSLVSNLAASSCQMGRGSPGPCSQNHIVAAKASVLEAKGVPLFEHFPLVCSPKEEAGSLGEGRPPQAQPVHPLCPSSFKESIQTHGYVDASGRVHCVSPLLYESGRIPFTLSMNNGRSFPRSGTWLSGEP